MGCMTKFLGTSPKNGITARLASLFLLVIGTVLISICLFLGFKIFKNKPFGDDVGQCAGSVETCSERLLIIKIGTALSAFFLLQLIFSISFLCDPMSCVQSLLAGYWLMKLILFAGILVGCYFIPPKVMIVLFYVCIVGSACFLIFQVYLFITFLISVNLNFITHERMCLLRSGFVLGLLLFGGLIGISFAFFYGCSLDIVFTAVAFVLGVVMLTITCCFHSVSSSVFTTALIMAYCAYLNLSTLLANPNTQCIHFPDIFGLSYKPSSNVSMEVGLFEEERIGSMTNAGIGIREVIEGGEDKENMGDLSYSLSGMDTLGTLLDLYSDNVEKSPSLSNSSFISLSSPLVSSLLTTSVVLPDKTSSLNDNLMNIVFKVLSLVLTFASLIYSTFSATGVSSTEHEKIDVDVEHEHGIYQKLNKSTPVGDVANDGESVDDKSDVVREVSYWKLNLVMVLASMHVVAVVCGWGFNDVSSMGGLRAGIGYSTMGFKCATHYICVLFYTWILINPYLGPIIFPNREWPTTEVAD